MLINIAIGLYLIIWCAAACLIFMSAVANNAGGIFNAIVLSLLCGVLWPILLLIILAQTTYFYVFVRILGKDFG